MYCIFFFFLMIRRPPRSTLSSSSAASDVYKRQVSTQSTGTSETPTMPGGYQQSKPVDEEIRTMVEALKEEAVLALQATGLNKAPTKWEPLTYQHQVVAGMNYRVVVAMDDGPDRVEVMIFKPLPHTGEPPKVTSVALVVAPEEAVLIDEPEMCCRMLGSVNGRENFELGSHLIWGQDGRLEQNL
eukprot:TRINITY_DN1285_c0_g2_i1.p1 TRINITY_DN1285_c0_g2~~TRINITY_DN1285_c0_g2_i1.p1  ORF type:complete len:185 (-),score=57.73 TRINITY_DN1285_c0_g2_i1:250-804(-)